MVNMKIEYDPPFYANTGDGNHCYQAVLRMILKHFQPEREFTWEELDEITGKVEGYWTWATAGLLWLPEQGYEIVNVETFDAERFSKEGGDYLIAKYGKAVAKEQIAHTPDMAREQELAKGFLAKVNVERRIPDLSEIEDYLRKGYLIFCNVNSKALNKKPGFTGHFVLIVGFDDKHLKMHDPGAPGHKGRIVTKNHFMKAWAYPDEDAKNFVAIRYRG